MSINFSPRYEIEVEKLVEGLDNGSIRYCDSDVYIRSTRSQELIDEKKQQLIFAENNLKVVRVIDPFTMYRDENGVLVLLNGNTRTEALYQLFKDEKTKKYIFDPVTYEILEEGFTKKDLRILQVVKNDTTEKHSLPDMAADVLRTKALLEEEYANSDLNPKAKAGKITDELCGIYRRHKTYIGHLLTFASLPEFVKTLVVDEQISLDNVIKVNRKLSEEPTLEEFQLAYDELRAIAGEGNKITNTHIVAWVNSKKVKDNLSGTTENDDDEVDNLNNNGSKDSKKKASPITIDEFRTKYQQTNNKFRLIERENVSESLIPVANEAVRASIGLLQSTFDIFPEQSGLDILEDIKDIILSRIGDVDSFIQRTETVGKEVSEIAQKSAKWHKAIDNLYAAIYESSNAMEQPEITEVQQPVETIEDVDYVADIQPVTAP